MAGTPTPIEGRTVILVDDGLATGSTRLGRKVAGLRSFFIFP